MLKRKGNKIEIKGGIMLLYPTNSPEEPYILDADDYNKIKDYTWYVHKNKIVFNNNGKTITLNRFLLNIEDKQYLVHNKNGNKKDLRKENLFVATKRKYNTYEFDKDTLYLYPGKTDEIYLFDKNDYEKLKNLYIYAVNGYLYTTINKKQVKVSSLIIGKTEKGEKIIHIDRNYINYKKDNLKIVSQKYNNKEIIYSTIIENNDGTIKVISDKNNEHIFPSNVKDCLINKKWVEGHAGHLQTREDNKTIMAYWYVIGTPINNLVVDHIDQNPRNNMLNNLRIVSISVNSQNAKLQSNNTSGYIGVYWNDKEKRWIARIGHNNKEIGLGQYKNILDAARAYDKKALELYGKHATTNIKLKRY